MSELLIAASSITHLAVHVKVRRLEYKLLYYESAVLLAAGLLSMMSVLTLKNSLVDNEGIFYTVIGSSVKGSLFPLEPVDLVFMGLGLGGSTILLDFLTRFYNWGRKGLLAVLPWIFVGQYRYLHEFVWVFSYWVTIDVSNGSFSESPKNSILALPPAVLTHSYAILFVLFTALAFVVLLRECKKNEDVEDLKPQL